MAAIQIRNFPTLVFVLYVVVFSRCSAKLNVFLDAREVSRFLHDLHRDLYLVRQGDVSAILRTPVLSSMIPPIDSHIREIKFRFNATGKVQYSLWFQSSNETIMKHPWANIPLKGLVPQKTRAFRVKFPCTAKRSGEVLLTINISFSDVNSGGIWGPLSLALKRHCDGSSLSNLNSTSDESPKATHAPSPQICNKRCNKKHVLKRYCVSDYVIKARIESEVMRSGKPQVRVHVMRMFKRGKVKMNTRQLLEKRGQEITCSCGNLKARKLYLILGKEDLGRRVLFIDDFTSAIEWNKNGRAYIRSQRKRNACPAKRIQ